MLVPFSGMKMSLHRRPLRSMQTQACDRCHKRKTRCDRRFPRCGACERANTPCVQTDKLNMQAYPRAYINSLEASLNRVTAEKQQLADELRELRASQAIPSPRSLNRQTPGDEILSPKSIDMEHYDADRGSPAAARDVIASEVGYLSLTATGEHRYLGSGSGVTLAYIVTSLVGSANLPRLSPDGHRRERLGLAPGAIPRVMALPEREAATVPIEAYFTHWHLTFPLLCLPQFMSIVDRIYTEPEYYSAHPFEAFVFDMVLGMGTVNFNRPDWAAAPGEVHYARAISKLEPVLSIKGLAPLQAIIFLCQYAIFCSQRDTSASMWHLVGIAVRLCVEMGLHRKSKLEDSAPQGTKGGSLQIDLEMKKRTFWCLYNLDRIISVTLGRPVALRNEDIDVSLPTAFDIDQLSLEKLQSGIDIPDLQYTSSFLHLIRIRRLAGNILQSIHCTNQNISDQEKYALRQKLHEELEAWKAEIPSIDKLPSGEDERLASSFRSPMWYEVPYHNAILLLYRPSSAFSHPEALIRSEAGTSVDILSQNLNSAKSVICLYAELHRTRRLNYSWITLHAVFIAGLTYVYAISRVIKDKAWSGLDTPGCLEYTRIIDDTRSCSNVLVAISERWGASRSSCEIFDRLSTAIIKDAVNASHGVHRSNPMPLGCTESAHNVLDEPSDAGDSNVDPRVHHGDGAAPSHEHQDTAFISSHYNKEMTPSSLLPESYHLSAETGFRQFYQDLQGGLSTSLPHNHGHIPSEVISGFSQNWFEGENADLGISNEAMDIWQIMGMAPGNTDFV